MPGGGFVTPAPGPIMRAKGLFMPTSQTATPSGVLRAPPTAVRGEGLHPGGKAGGWRGSAPVVSRMNWREYACYARSIQETGSSLSPTDRGRVLVSSLQGALYFAQVLNPWRETFVSRPALRRREAEEKHRQGSISSQGVKHGRADA